MSGGKWLRLQASLMHDEPIVELGAEHGPGGPLVFVALLCSCKRDSDDGTVKLGWQQLARKTFLENGAQARAIITTCAELALLADVAETTRGFTARIVDWEDYQRTADPKAAKRMRELRERKKEAQSQQSQAMRYAVTPVTPGVTGTNIPEVTASYGDNKNVDVNTNVDGSNPAVVVTPEGAAALAVHGIDPSITEISHPLYPQLLAIGEEGRADPDGLHIQVYGPGVERVLRNVGPDVDVIAAAQRAVARMLSGDVETPHYFRVLDWELQNSSGHRVKASRGARHQSDEDAERLERMAAEARVLEAKEATA